MIQITYQEACESVYTYVTVKSTALPVCESLFQKAYMQSTVKIFSLSILKKYH